MTAPDKFCEQVLAIYSFAVHFKIDISVINWFIIYKESEMHKRLYIIKKSSYSYDDLLASGRGELFGKEDPAITPRQQC